MVIGAGMAGLAAAYVYHREKKGRCRILMLDNHDDFGGHARRNTFHYQGTTLIAHGGNFELELPQETPRSVKEIFREVGINPERMLAFRDESGYEQLGLSTGVFFDPRVYAGIKPTWVTGYHEIPYDQFFAKAPIPEKARAELVELHTTRKNYLPDVPSLKKALAEMSWETFIRSHMKLGSEAVQFANLYAVDLIGLGCDAVSALAGQEVGPGFAGMGGKAFSQVRRQAVLQQRVESALPGRKLYDDAPPRPGDPPARPCPTAERPRSCSTAASTARHWTGPGATSVSGCGRWRSAWSMKGA